MKKKGIFTLLPNKDAPIFALAEKYPPSSAYEFQWWEEKLEPRTCILLAPHAAHRKPFFLKTSSFLNSGDVVINSRTRSVFIILSRNEENPALSFVRRAPGRYLKPGKRGDTLLLMGRAFLEQKE